MGKLTDKERKIIDEQYEKHKYDNVEFLTPDEAHCLLDCYANESMRRYGKLNEEAPLYLKLQRIARLYQITAKDGTEYRNVGDYIDSGT